jgi:putative nucleotidyltransferase with HDIG domain
MKRNAVRVPPCPTAALKLRTVLGNPEHEVAEVVEVAKSDPTLAAAVLRVANSVFFRRDQPATTLKGAVQRIGEKEIERLALAAGLAHELLKDGPLATVRRGIWHDAMTGAVVCEALARTRPHMAPDEAFLVGLLHDVGKMVAVGAIEHILTKHKGLGARSAEVWYSVVERFHVELGLVLAVRWALPEVVSDVISQHHAQPPVGPYAEMASLVAAGDQVAALLSTGQPATSEVLAAVPWLRSQHEREVVAASLLDAATIIAGFEPEPSMRAPGPSLVAEAPLEPIKPPGTFEVRLISRDMRCQGVLLEQQRLQFLSPAPLTPNYLAELEVSRDGQSVRAWTKVTTCQPSLGQHRVEVVPFALSGAVVERWRAFCAAA